MSPYIQCLLIFACVHIVYMAFFCGIPAILGKRRADTTSFVVVAATKLDSVLDNN